jgi:hypothetical protein
MSAIMSPSSYHNTIADFEQGSAQASISFCCAAVLAQLQVQEQQRHDLEGAADAPQQAPMQH